MTNRAAAARYARALLDVSIREADPEQVERELGGFAALVREHAALERALVSPAVPAARKQQLVAELAARSGLSPVVTKLLVLLAQRDRLGLLPDLVDAYRSRLLDHLQVVRAEVTTAVPLAPEHADALAHGLAKATGRRVSMVARIDPAIIGGVIARVGSTVYDGSVRRQLERMKATLVEGA